MTTRRSLGIGMLIGGVLLLAIGLNASGSFASDVSEAFTGSPTDLSVWMIILGSATAVAGLFMAMVTSRSH